MTAPAEAQQPQQRQPKVLDGLGVVFEDSLLQQLAGDWTMTGAVRGRPVSYRLHVEWVLDHQFLRLDMRDVAAPPAYQAIVLLGVDNRSARYVAHWIDVFGGRFSETLGYGRRDGDAVRFTFEYPDGPFHTTFTFDPTARAWRILMEDRDADGAWREFAHYRLERK